MMQPTPLLRASRLQSDGKTPPEPLKPPKNMEIVKFPDMTEAKVADTAARLAPCLRDGDVLFLYGDLGAGKTSFARALIRTLCERPDEEVPSPTFSLVQRYELENTAAPAIWHFDLYRLDAPDDVYELGFEEALDDGIVLIEWPERLGALAPAGALEVRFEATNTEARRNLDFVGGNDWAVRLSGLASDSAPDSGPDSASESRT